MLSASLLTGHLIACEAMLFADSPVLQQIGRYVCMKSVIQLEVLSEKTNVGG